MSSESFRINGWQQFVFVLLRFAIGWHLFFQGLGKVWDPRWTARGYLANAIGPFSGIYRSIAESPSLLMLAEWATIWGLLLSGICLMLGLFTRLSALVGFGLLMLFYLAAPPLAHQGFVVTGIEGTELWVNKTLIQALALLVILAVPTGRMVGLDILIRHWRTSRQSA